MYQQYLRTVIESIQERTNADFYEKIVSIFSIMLFVFRYPLAGAAIPSLKQHIKRKEIYYVDYNVNLCFWTAYSFITMPNSKDKRWKKCSRIAETKLPVIGFNSAKFDASILFKNLKSKDWAISKELNKCEPFPIEAFDNTIRNKKLSEVKYKDYLVEAAKHKSRCDYLKHYNILDTRVLIEPIDYLIKLMFKYKVDLLAIISMSQCSNAIKYSMAHNDIDINDNYNYESTDKLIEITQCYLRAKLDSYIEQVNKTGRDSCNNVTIDDYDYFKELFKNQRYNMCNARFIWKNRPTLDIIDISKRHSKDNVIPYCLYCNVCRANRDKKNEINGIVKEICVIQTITHDINE
ncbi:MAG: hypothetical protein EZS28_002374 [Streblomastix strix]|uniref:Uncharacterized protein n=1 Tax=Streblomastix strix TaxID=222440 RepID=A0A5J4X546_9EUKA|nr:MAG: hypothetical protein EZS28_002374 [Streblomastix strix]